jgi:hypothetical protein
MEERRWEIGICGTFDRGRDSRMAHAMRGSINEFSGVLFQANVGTIAGLLRLRTRLPLSH